MTLCILVILSWLALNNLLSHSYCIQRGPEDHLSTLHCLWTSTLNLPLGLFCFSPVSLSFQVLGLCGFVCPLSKSLHPPRSLVVVKKKD